MDSSPEIVSCLRLLAVEIPKNNSELMRAFKNVTESLSSDSEYRRVTDALIN